jgi:hypothetical protein
VYADVCVCGVHRPPSVRVPGFPSLRLIDIRCEPTPIVYQSPTRCAAEANSQSVRRRGEREAGIVDRTMRINRAGVAPASMVSAWVTRDLWVQTTESVAPHIQHQQRQRSSSSVGEAEQQQQLSTVRSGCSSRGASSVAARHLTPPQTTPPLNTTTSTHQPPRRIADRRAVCLSLRTSSSTHCNAPASTLRCADTLAMRACSCSCHATWAMPPHIVAPSLGTSERLLACCACLRLLAPRRRSSMYRRSGTSGDRLPL